MDRAVAGPVLPAPVGDRSADLVFPQYPDNLLFSKAAALSVLVLSMGQNELQSGVAVEATSLSTTIRAFFRKAVSRRLESLISPPKGGFSSRNLRGGLRSRHVTMPSKARGVGTSSR